MYSKKTQKQQALDCVLVLCILEYKGGTHALQDQSVSPRSTIAAVEESPPRDTAMAEYGS